MAEHPALPRTGRRTACAGNAGVRVLSTLFALFAACALAAAGAVRAQDYPSKPIRILMPYTPRTQSDIVARMIGGSLAEKFKQPVIVDDRPGEERSASWR